MVGTLSEHYIYGYNFIDSKTFIAYRLSLYKVLLHQFCEITKAKGSVILFPILIDV